ncbi:hypothetical protein [Pseudomonas sp. MWU12-2323]|uniref:hypothetical protein n=1 Tax=Pseudomonas sp. MWU12-2323 TaxID=2651296 RepID=UPI00128B93BC|nr:hypothetical protein [Pseudomonas sp. MWU12-2323]MPQ69415.1 hypothetical protein [Pseudomonas sp. MWU12-2323]
MKDVVQIKAELVEHQHDALMTFYDTYPRLFVNKLLLRLCEGCMADYPPSLAQFTTSEPLALAKKRKVVIRLNKSLSPAFWEFYKGLPYGARSVVIINLMNHYAQIAEADKQLLERVYWSSASESPPTLPTPQPAITTPRAVGGLAGETKPAGQARHRALHARESENEGKGSTTSEPDGSAGSSSGSGPEQLDDPLLDIDVEL